MGMLMVMNRDVRVIGRSGNAIAFKKGKHTHVPDSFVETCMSKGAVPVDAEAELPQVDAKPEAQPAPVGIARKERVMDTFAIMVQENVRGSFTANGHPKIRNLKAKLGFDIDVKEAEKLWQEFESARIAEASGEVATDETEVTEHDASIEDIEE